MIGWHKNWSICQIFFKRLTSSDLAGFLHFQLRYITFLSFNHKATLKFENQEKWI